MSSKIKSLRPKKPKLFSQHHVAVSAEAFVAAQFARYGFDVSVQYGADQPEYDLVIVRGTTMAKISVKGSQDGGWGLAQNYLEKGKANYQEAIEKWLTKHSIGTVYCFVQFQNVELDEMPRMFLALPEEIAKRLKASSNNRGNATLYEFHQWGKNSDGKGTLDKIPDAWKFSKERIEELLVKLKK